MPPQFGFDASSNSQMSISRGAGPYSSHDDDKSTQIIDGSEARGLLAKKKEGKMHYTLIGMCFVNEKCID